MLALVSCVVGGFVAGWVIRGLRRQRRLGAAQVRWQKIVDELQGKLALERLRIDNYIRQQPSTPEPAPAIELQLDSHLARPHARTSDSTVARA